MAGDSDNESKKNEGGLPTPAFRKDPESKEEKLPYPKAVFFIVTNEFCERFSYYGMKAVLTLYLNNVLNFSEDTSTVIYHVFSMLAYFTPLLGAMIADSLLGKFKTIFYLSVVYAAGNVILALAATPPLSLPAMPISMLGLALIALGTGGIKPCVAAFGGDQFVLPQQAAQLATFFSFFYMAINSGSLISTAITPIMRADVQCFDQETCYALAFAIPAVLMIVALLIFLSGKFMYRETKPSGNVVLKVVKCIAHAISRKRSSKASRSHWLDNADDTYEPRFIEDVKIVLRVLVLYLPLPIFWSLFDQQGSRWTLQATRMNGVVAGYAIKPDQIQVLNPLLILLFIPLFDYAVYPVLAKCRLLTRPLQRLTAGGILAGFAFVISGIIELELEKTYPNKLALSESNLNFVNTLPCDIQLDFNGEVLDDPIKSQMSHIFKNVEAATYSIYTKDKEPSPKPKPFIKLTPDPKCPFQTLELTHVNTKKTAEELKGQEETEEEKQGGSFTYFISGITENKDKRRIELAYEDRSDDRAKPKEGNPKVRFTVAGDVFETYKGRVHVYIDGGHTSTYQFPVSEPRNASEKFRNAGQSSATKEVQPTEYKLRLVLEGSESSDPTVTHDLKSFEVKLGGSYVIAITNNQAADNKDSFSVHVETITKESTLHVVWLLPQYIVITAAEIMFSITGLEFSYSQSPVSMKSVMQSAWLLTVAFGNLIVIIIAAVKFFDEQSKEFFLFAGLMFIDMIWFAFMAYRYVPAQLEDPTKKKDDDYENED